MTAEGISTRRETVVEEPILSTGEILTPDKSPTGRTFEVVRQMQARLNHTATVRPPKPRPRHLVPNLRNRETHYNGQRARGLWS